ncbi:hypothetical protein [Mesorhizobium sp. IMUNJ 23232]|uniref:hypothetical protein n=1 Tax=Mesorhizobium sp. IMUNJ 23232 TaxID=3376064 RepID=UPI0037B19BBF
MKPIATNIEPIRKLVDGIKPKMHPGDYSADLVNIVYYALAEAERLSRITGNNRTLVDMVREIESLASTHVPRGPHIN